MSEDFDPEKIKKIVSEQEQREKLKKVSDAVRMHENTQKMKKIAEGKRLQEDLVDIDFSMDFQQLAADANEDVEQRKNAVPFMFDELSDFIQLAPGSLALICASTGTGKSTFTANIANTLYTNGKRVLIIANEEKKSDVAARISCLQLGVNIHKYKRKDVPETVYKSVIDNIEMLDDKRLSIIALDYKDNSSIVTSPEGMESLLEKAAGKFDAIIIDYYQNINHSLNNPGCQAHEANEMFAKSIDYIKNKIGCPIIMMAQIRRGDDDYKIRLEGRRLILNKCTDIFEVKIDKINSRSVMICQKDRWLNNQGDERFIGYKGGEFVPYTREFEEDIKSRQVDKIDVLTVDKI